MIKRKLPVAISIPHAGQHIPDEVREIFLPDDKRIAADGDLGADVIYNVDAHVAKVIRFDIARAVVDANRAPDDFSDDGVVKTVTVFGDPVYASPISSEVRTQLLNRYYAPYHRHLSGLGKNPGVFFCLDCHTMLPVGPPTGPDPGKERPHVCISDIGSAGKMPRHWAGDMVSSFVAVFGSKHVAFNSPFQGGYITRTYGRSFPWLQIELSRATFADHHEKQAMFLDALNRFCCRIV